MKVLVIIPMYNAGRFIRECLTSILSQGVDLQVIVIDDASTDNSASIVSEFPEVKLLTNSKNMGTYYSINLGLLEASSDTSWTHYLIHGADDISNPNRFKKQLSLFKPNTLAVGCLFERVHYLTGAKKINNPWVNESVILMSRQIFESLGYYDTNRAGCDTEYRNRLVLAFPNSISQIDEILIKSYLHDDNLTKKIPLGGSERKAYVASFTRIHKEMDRTRRFYKEFKKI
jgi:glycosyltransferase involved in cell wall biosynthesis